MPKLKSMDAMNIHCMTNDFVISGFTRVSSHLEWIKEVTGIGCK